LIPNSIKVTDGIYWGGSFAQLKTLLNQNKINENEIRFFLGYAGWSPDQLEDELDEKSWFVRENTYFNILDIKIDQLWKSNLLSFGSKYQIWVNAPSNPSLN
jgi:putative transcriptional regulator